MKITTDRASILMVLIQRSCLHTKTFLWSNQTWGTRPICRRFKVSLRLEIRIVLAGVSQQSGSSFLNNFRRHSLVWFQRTEIDILFIRSETVTSQVFRRRRFILSVLFLFLASCVSCRWLIVFNATILRWSSSVCRLTLLQIYDAFVLLRQRKPSKTTSR